MGAVLDKGLRSKMHAAPSELTRQLPPPARKHSYVTIGGHVGLIDDKNQVKAVIHLTTNGKVRTPEDPTIGRARLSVISKLAEAVALSRSRQPGG
jgi:hypothetical protein